MKKEFSMEAFLNKLRNDKFITSIGMPMDHAPGLPVIRRINGETCITVPFIKRRISRKVVKEDNSRFDVVEVYPVRYAVTYALRAVELPEIKDQKAAVILAGNEEFLANTITEGKPIAFEDLSYRPDYVMPNKDRSGTVPINCSFPIGIFKANSTEYSAKLKEIYKCYDKAVNIRLDGRLDGTIETRLINMLIEILDCEPSIRQFYKMLDDGLFGQRLAGVE